MASLRDAIYLRLPRRAQNLAISWYGRKEFNIRYGSALEKPFDTVRNRTPLSADELAELQNARLREIVIHAGQFVPHYRDVFKERGVDPASVTIDNFTSVLPVLSKAEIVAAPDRFVSEMYRDNCLRLFTSGTSGSPMPIACTPSARAANYAFFRRMINEAGRDVTDRSATFAGRILFSPREKRQFWRTDSFNKTLLMSSYHLSDQTIPDYIRALEQWQPTYIDSYPSAIGEIARYINEHAVAHRIAPDFILTSSETLTETQREDIRRAFNNTRIIDHFGCSEMAVSAYTRADNRYLIEPLYALVDFAPLDNSSSTSLLCTGLLNMAMPLLRYQIGDTVEDGRAGLGPAYADRTFAAVAGREDDLIITPDGRRIGRLDPAFKGLDGISRAQIIQHSPEELQVLVVPATGADRAAVAHKLESNLQARTDPRMHIRIDFVDDIPLTKSGKFKSVISKIGKNG